MCQFVSGTCTSTFDQIISLQKIMTKDGSFDGVDKVVAEKLTAKIHFLTPAVKSGNFVASRASQLDLDRVVSGVGFVLRP